MNYTKKQFLADVASEAKALKKNATKTEINKLNFGRLDPTNTRHCVYGQMAGGCRSIRAVELITKCCKRFIRQVDGTIPRDMAKIKEGVNGTKSESPHSTIFLSTIENYIVLPNAKNKNLIAYLKGERKDLVL